MRQYISKKFVFPMLALLFTAFHANADSVGHIKIQNLYEKSPNCIWFASKGEGENIHINIEDTNIRANKFSDDDIQNTSSTSNYVGYGWITYGVVSPCNSMHQIANCTIYFGLDTNNHLIPNVTAQGSKESGCTNGVPSKVTVQDPSNLIFSIGYSG